MLRIAETFESVVVPDRIREMLSSIPLANYERNCWNGALHRGEKRAPILQTQGTDIFAECLAFTVTHLVIRVAESGMRTYGMLLDRAWERQASRLGAEFAHRLTEALVVAIREDRADSKIDARDGDTERTIDSFRIIAQIMYPSISEIRTALANYRHDDPTMLWLKAIDHALYLTTTPPGPTERPVLDSLATLFDAALYAFYPFFLATAFGESVYAQFEGVHDDPRVD